MTATTRSTKCSAPGAPLMLALELGSTKWLLGFTTAPAQRPRVRTMPAGDLPALEKEIQLAKARFGLPLDAPVHSCYEAGRDGFWLHRWLIARDIENVVVDSSSIEVNRRARRAKTDRLDVGKLLALLLRSLGGDSRLALPWWHRLACHDRRPPGRPGPEYTVVEQEVDPRPWHEHRQPSQELNRIEDQVRRTVRPRLPEVQPHPPCAGDAEPFPRHGWPQRVPAHPLEPLPLSGGHHEAGMQVKAVRPRMTVAERARLDPVGRGTQTTNAGAPLAPQRHTALHRGRGQPSQHWCLVCPLVRLTGALVILADAPAVEQTRDPRSTLARTPATFIAVRPGAG